MKNASLSARRRRGRRLYLLHQLFTLVLYLAVVVLLSFLLTRFVVQKTLVEGTSMVPALENGDQLLVNRLVYRFKDPERFDIVVFRYRYSENTYYIKRIIGLPGETVQIVDGEIYIDGDRLTEDYGAEVMENAGRAYEPVTLGEDEYFVLGDNRNVSSDSRDPSVGNVTRSEILGKAFVRIWPLSSLGSLY